MINNAAARAMIKIVYIKQNDYSIRLFILFLVKKRKRESVPTIIKAR